MKVALSGVDSRDGALLSKVKKTLESLNVKTQIMKDDYQSAKEVDLVMVAGGDRGILDYFHKVETDSAPVLGIYETDSTGFLAQLEVRDLETAMSRLKRNDYSVDKVFRISVKVDGKQVDPVLNDVAVFPSKSATLMEHVLRIDGNDIWHDNSDGVIISTPTGSTAYSMSAGGPMVLQKAPVFLAVSVNSLDNTRRPLVVPNDSRLEIADITSRYHCEVVLDGGRRMQIKNTLECSKHEFSARLVRLVGGSSSAASLMAKKVQLAEDMLKMPPSAKLILKTLEYEGALSQKDLAARTMLPERTIRLSLSHLINQGYVKKKTSLRDARQRIYELKI
ncbi:MAG: sugar kinase [Thaumarchaeota archaeon 13_1_40CM_3_50_5]|nr:MAG: sugar kinase [Thaumarchaeota archaeon 13_1_40CM_4_48_7]OLC25563.1 MAG: sugar kinase [Candidatus Nitrososphaera sp. 13_1_40CM_48_12]OLC86944.1 MAG: sugar kinase [Thaumarchaeota archaeon 13_1_40CM_3_50_5]TLY02152.1 MAG: sugar kinase [Nitrososphaerota archaeon]HEU0048838.1 sugar kinase [Nitrososphaera sp.]